VLINGVNFSGDKIENFCRRHGVTKLSLFGSILRELGAESGHGFRLTGDVDVLVEFLPEKVPSLLVFAGLPMELSTLVGREVQLCTAPLLSRFFFHEVLREARLLRAA